MNEKVLKQIIILKIPAGSASAKAPLGPTLGQYSIPIAEFCSKFNTLTEEYKQGMLLKAIVHMYDDQTYDLSVGNPDTSFFIKTAIQKETGAGKTGKYKIKENNPCKEIITTEMLYEISKIKYEGGLNKTYYKIKSLYKAMVGTARSMGIVVVPSKYIQ